MSPSRSRRRRPRKKKSNNKKIILIVALLAVAVTIIVGYNMLGNNTSNENLPSTNKVLLETSMGNITIQLRDDMPITTQNFKNLVQQGVYDGTIFHRVIANFMIQGGDPMGTGQGDPSIPNIPDEFSDNPENNKNEMGTIAMANSLEKHLYANNSVVLYALKEIEDTVYDQHRNKEFRTEYLLLTDKYLADSKQKNRIHRLLQISKNKKVKTRVVNAETPAGNRISQFGGIVFFSTPTRQRA